MKLKRQLLWLPGTLRTTVRRDISILRQLRLFLGLALAILVVPNSIVGGNASQGAQATATVEAGLTGPNLSNTPGESQDPDLATAGENVYIVWSDLSTGNGDIFLAVSTDHGASFRPAINLSKTITPSSHPTVAAEGKNVFVVWEEQGLFSTLFFTVSKDFGESFATPAQLETFFGDAFEPKALAMWGNGYVAWRAVERDLLTGGAGFERVQFNVIGEPVVTTIVRVPWQVQDISLAGGGTSLYVSWSGNFMNRDLDPYFSTSTDRGHSFRVNQYPEDQASPQGDYGDQHNGGVAANANTVIWYYESNRIPFRTVRVLVSQRQGAGIFDGAGHFYSLNQSTVYSDLTGEAFRTPMTPRFVVDGSRFIGAWIVARPQLGGGFVKELHSWRSDRPEFEITSSGNPRDPHIAVSGDTSLVVYEADEAPAGIADVFAYLAADATSRAFNLSKTAEPSLHPKVAASGANYVVVWTEETKDNTEIFFRTIASRPPVTSAPIK
jgi:hypothetical protein